MGEADIVGDGSLSPADYKSFLERHPGIKSVELSNFGELFMNPGLLEILKISRDMGVSLSADNGVNANTVSEEVLVMLVDSGFRSMSVSIDGASQQTYGRYRVGGCLDIVLDNIRVLNRLKREKRSVLPKLTWKMIVFPHNICEIPDARRFARDLDMGFSLSYDYMPDDGEGKLVEDLLEREAVDFVSMYHESRRKNFCFCHQLWTDPQINWDGHLLGCCVNRWGDYGNVFEEGLEKIMKSQDYLYARLMVRGKAPERVDIPCSRCHVYKRMVDEGRFISHGDIVSRKLFS